MQRARALGADSQVDLCARRAPHDPFELEPIIGRRASGPPVPDFVRAPLQVTYLLPALARDELHPLWHGQFDLNGPYIFALKRLLTGVGRQEAAVLDDGNDVEESLTLRLGGEMRESQVGAERGHRERPLAMLLAHLRQVFERCVILVEFILPAANLN